MGVRNEKGQMTVEFMAAVPVLLVVAVIAVNALTFFGDCASFDNLFRDAVRTQAASPAYGQDVAQSASLVETTLKGSFDRSNLKVQVGVEGVSGGLSSFTGTLEYWPTLFGMGLRQEVWGVQLPSLKHSVRLSIDCYKPGVLL